ncbi:MAG: helix-turn-helix domain-containing protein [Flavobacteriaceae bacterium]
MQDLWVSLPICPIEIHTTRRQAEDYPKSLNTLADHIKAKRLDQRLSQKQLAKILDVKVQTFWTWETMGANPLPIMMKRIVIWLGYVPMIGRDKNMLSGQLYTFRMNHGYTQKHIAEILRIDRWAVTKIENDKTVDQKYIDRIRELITNR